MAFIGNTVTTQGFTPAIDYFSGNASTTAFTLSRPVASVAQVQAVIENVPQNPGSAFTVSSNTITFTSAPPTGTNNIYVYYTSPITQVIQPSQGTVGNTQMVTGAALANIGSGGITSTYLASAAVAQSNLGTNVVGTGPAFKMYLSTNQSFSTSTWTKATLNAKSFDTANACDTTTNYRFQPTVAGYYLANASAYHDFSSAGNQSRTAIYKNGTVYAQGAALSGNLYGTLSRVTDVVYLNGSTDYIEMYVYSTHTGPIINSGAENTYMSGVLVRAA